MTRIEEVVVVPRSAIERQARKQSYAWCLGVLAGFGAALAVTQLALRSIGVFIF